jgi:predicted MPP superfamily phosphohydrolase
MLPEMFIQLAALLLGLRFLRKKSNPLSYIVLAASSILLLAGFAATLSQGLGNESGFDYLLVSGLAFAWAASLLAAFGIHLGISKLRERWLPCPLSSGRRNLLSTASGVAMAFPAVTLASGFLIGRKKFHLEEADLAVPDLPLDLEGLRIVQLSDIHLSPYLSRDELAYCVGMANDARAHLAVVTGDLVTGQHDPINDCLDELKRLRADAGVYGCMGNHEGYIFAESYVKHEAAQRGMRFLRHEHCQLRFGSAKLNLAGVDHQWEKKTYLMGVSRMIRATELNVLMSHNPATFPQAAAQGWHVTLAGHMHGGQINFELMRANLNYVRISTPYVYGPYYKDRSAMYVTRGIGTVAMPVRFGAPPEVALIRLRRA